MEEEDKQNGSLITSGAAFLVQDHLPPDLLLHVTDEESKPLTCLSLVTLTFCYLQLNAVLMDLLRAFKVC